MTIWKMEIIGFGATATLISVGKISNRNGSGQAPDSHSSDPDLSTVTIGLERTSCFGTCPAYSIVINGDGRVDYNGRSSVKETRTRHGRIESEKLRALVSEFEKARFE